MRRRIIGNLGADLLSVKTMKWLIGGVALVSGLFAASVPFAVAQTESSLAIRVKSNQVLVPVFVYNKQLWDRSIYSPAGYRCLVDSAKALQKEGISVRQAPVKCWGGFIEDLATKDFRVFEDGIEQTIQNVSRERRHWWQLFDNFGSHSEYSGIPIGKWSTADFGSSIDWHWSPVAEESYVIAYVPPQSNEGSCHQVKISVNRRNAVVYNRSEYCNVQRSLSDPLEATTFGQQLEIALGSPTKAQIPMLAASGLFFTDIGNMLAHFVLEFPQKSLHREWLSGNLVASIGVLGMAYRKDGTLAARFSDQACCPRDIPLAHVNESQATNDDDSEIPTRYEAELELPVGDYDFRVILSDGKKFGRIDIPLSIESTDIEPLGLSSVALCKRYHRVDPPSYTEGLLPSKFVPLVSKGMEFTPAADTSFGKRDPLFAYFEIYAPSGVSAADAGDTNARSLTRAAPAVETSAPKAMAELRLLTVDNFSVHFELKITNLKTGRVQIDSGLRPTNEFVQAGKAVIPIVQEVTTHDLPKGDYRLEVQATDSAGHRTPWHTATFTIR